MRLWHQSLIPLLPRQQLLSLHRECCALRGNRWGKKHATADYVFKHSYAMLFEYHRLVMQEMIKRGFKVAYKWTVSQYRGNNCDAASYQFYIANHSYRSSIREPVYPEHDEAYMQECLEILRGMGIDIERDKIGIVKEYGGFWREV